MALLSKQGHREGGMGGGGSWEFGWTSLPGQKIIQCLASYNLYCDSPQCSTNGIKKKNRTNSHVVGWILIRALSWLCPFSSYGKCEVATTQSPGPLSGFQKKCSFFIFILWTSAFRVGGGDPPPAATGSHKPPSGNPGYRPV